MLLRRANFNKFFTSLRPSLRLPLARLASSVCSAAGILQLAALPCQLSALQSSSHSLTSSHETHCLAWPHSPPSASLRPVCVALSMPPSLPAPALRLAANRHLPHFPRFQLVALVLGVAFGRVISEWNVLLLAGYKMPLPPLILVIC